MKIYKSSSFVIVKNCVYALFGGAAAALIASIWLDWQVAAAIGGGLCLLMLYFALFGDRISICIDGDSVRILRGQKVKQAFLLSQVELSAHIKTVDSDSDCTLTARYPDNSTKSIDCTMLGRARFLRLLDDLGVTNQPVKIPTQINKS